MFYFYDTYISWYNYYYGITNEDKEEIVTRIIEMDEEGEVLDDNIVNTTTNGEKIIPTFSINEIKTIGEDTEGTEVVDKTIAEYVKQYCVETNYRLRGKKKHNSLLTKG